MVAIIKVAGFLLAILPSIVSAVPTALPAIEVGQVYRNWVLVLQSCSKEPMNTKENLEKRSTSTSSANNGSLEKRRDPLCWQSTGNRCSARNARTGVEYLRSLGSTKCVVTGFLTTFVRVGDCDITGGNYSTKEVVSSPCLAVARGLDWVISNCQLGSTMGGAADPIGNHNFMSRIQGQQ